MIAGASLLKRGDQENETGNVRGQDPEIVENQADHRPESEKGGDQGQNDPFPSPACNGRCMLWFTPYHCYCWVGSWVAKPLRTASSLVLNAKMFSHSMSYIHLQAHWYRGQYIALSADQEIGGQWGKLQETDGPPRLHLGTEIGEETDIEIGLETDAPPCDYDPGITCLWHCVPAEACVFAVVKASNVSPSALPSL